MHPKANTFETSYQAYVRSVSSLAHDLDVCSMNLTAASALAVDPDKIAGGCECPFMPIDEPNAG